MEPPKCLCSALPPPSGSEAPGGSGAGTKPGWDGKGECRRAEVAAPPSPGPRTPLRQAGNWFSLSCSVINRDTGATGNCSALNYSQPGCSGSQEPACRAGQ